MDVIWEILLLIYSGKPHPNMDLSVYRSDDPDPEYEVSLDLAATTLEISCAKAKCCRCRMGQTAKWLAEISFAIVEAMPGESTSESTAKSYFDLQKYDRAAFSY